MLYPLQPIVLLFQVLTALSDTDGGPLIDPNGIPVSNPNGLEEEGEAGPLIDPNG